MDAAPIIITGILMVVSVFLGAKYLSAKDKVKQFKDVLEAWDKAWEDDNITTAEWEEIATKIKTLLGKK